MQLEFEITPDDRRALIGAIRKAPEGRRQSRSAFLKAFAMSCAPLVVIIWTLLLGHADGRAYLVLVVVPFLCSLALWLWAYPRGQKKADETFANPPDEVGLGKHVLTLSAVGVAEQQPYGQVLHRWPFVKPVVAGPDHLFIPVTGGQYYIVPKRAFRTAEELAAFVEILQARGEGAA